MKKLYEHCHSSPNWRKLERCTVQWEGLNEPQMLFKCRAVSGNKETFLHQDRRRRKRRKRRKRRRRRGMWVWWKLSRRAISCDGTHLPCQALYQSWYKLCCYELYNGLRVKLEDEKVHILSCAFCERDVAISSTLLCSLCSAHHLLVWKCTRIQCSAQLAMLMQCITCIAHKHTLLTMTELCPAFFAAPLLSSWEKP